MRMFSFVEESVWKGEEHRSVRNSVVFRLVSVGKIQGIRLDEEFMADFGLWYDPDDTRLIEKLTELNLGIDWGGYVFWRKPDGIDVIQYGDEEVTVASIVVRKRMGGDPVAEVDTTNVVSMSGFRTKKAMRVFQEIIDDDT